MQGSLIISLTCTFVIVHSFPCMDFSRMSKEELEWVSNNTMKFLGSLTCADARDLRIFNEEKATKGEKVALENLKSLNPQVYEKHTTYLKNVFKTLGEEGTQFFVKAESLGDALRKEAAQGESTIIEALKDEYKSLSAETRANLETEFPIFRLEDALDIIYVRPFMGQQ